MMNCMLGHDWSWPRRWKVFEGKRDIDVQCCQSCGKYRKSLVTFGVQKPPRPVPVAVESAEVEA